MYKTCRYIGFRKQPTTLERLTYFVGVLWLCIHYKSFSESTDDIMVLGSSGGVVVVGALVQEGVVFEEVSSLERPAVYLKSDIVFTDQRLFFRFRLSLPSGHDGCLMPPHP